MTFGFTNIILGYVRNAIPRVPVLSFHESTLSWYAHSFCVLRFFSVLGITFLVDFFLSILIF